MSPLTSLSQWRWRGVPALADLYVEEETLLIGFFGMDYVRYRDKTRVGIPFIP